MAGNEQAAASNITKFRPDRRGQVCGLFKSVALIGLLCSLVYCIWNYHDKLSLRSLRQLASYFSASQAAGSADFAGYTFEAGTSSVYDDFGNGLAVMDSDTLSFINAQGREELSLQLKYTTPALSVAGDNMLAYDRGGKNLCLTNRYTALWQKELESDIISASVNNNGAFSVVTDEQGYRAAVTLYDNRQQEQFKWNTSEYYILFSCVAPDSRHLAALCMSEAGGKRNTRVRVFRTSQEDALFDIDLGSMTVYSMEYYKNDALVVVADQGVFFYNGKGALEGQFPYTEGALVTFSHKMGQLPCVALETGDKDLRTRVVMVGEDGAPVFDRSYAATARSVSAAGDYIAVLLRDSVIHTATSPAAPEQAVEEFNARDVIQRSDGSVMLIYADRAELVEFPPADAKPQ